MNNEYDNSYFVRLPLVDGLKILADSKLAFRLYFWYVARITTEYRTAWGVRCGGVLGLSPRTDRDVAADIAKCSQVRCTEWTVRSWRRALKKLGLVAWQQTPVGLRVFVIGSNKMPDEKVVELPEWGKTIVAKAVRAYLARYGGIAKMADRPGENSRSDRQEMASRPAKVCRSNIREQSESECETEVTKQATRQNLESAHEPYSNDREIKGKMDRWINPGRSIEEKKNGLTPVETPPPITKEEEEQNAERVWAQLMELPGGAEILTGIERRCRPNTGRAPKGG